MRSACFWCTPLDFKLFKWKIKNVFAPVVFSTSNVFFSGNSDFWFLLRARTHVVVRVHCWYANENTIVGVCISYITVCTYYYCNGPPRPTAKKTRCFSLARIMCKGRPALFSAKILVFRSPYFNDVLHSLITVRKNYVRFVVVLWDYLSVSSNPHHPRTSKCLSSYCCKNQSFRDQQSPTNTTL